MSEYKPPKQIMAWLRQDDEGTWFVKDIRNPEDPKHKDRWNCRSISERDHFETYELKEAKDGEWVE